MFANLYAALVDAVPGRGITVGVALATWLSGVIGQIADMVAEPISARWGSGPLLVGFSVLTLFAIPCVRIVTGKMAAEPVPVGI